MQGKSDRLRFVRGVVRHPDAVRDFADKHGLALSSDYAELLADPKIQAIVLATPNSLHASGAKPRRLSFEPVNALRFELEAFADAVAGRAAYPVPTSHMIQTVSALEAIAQAIKSRSPVTAGAP